MLFSIYASLLGQLSADFTGLLTYTAFAFDMPAGGLGKAFPGVTPSFHLSDYQFSYKENDFLVLLLVPNLFS